MGGAARAGVSCVGTAADTEGVSNTTHVAERVDSGPSSDAGLRWTSDVTVHLIADRER